MFCFVKSYIGRWGIHLPTSRCVCFMKQDSDANDEVLSGILTKSMIYSNVLQSQAILTRSRITTPPPHFNLEKLQNSNIISKHAYVSVQTPQSPLPTLWKFRPNVRIQNPPPRHSRKWPRRLQKHVHPVPVYPPTISLRRQPDVDLPLDLSQRGPVRRHVRQTPGDEPTQPDAVPAHDGPVLEDLGAAAPELVFSCYRWC